LGWCNSERGLRYNSGAIPGTSAIEDDDDDEDEDEALIRGQEQTMLSKKPRLPEPSESHDLSRVARARPFRHRR